MIDAEKERVARLISSVCCWADSVNDTINRGSKGFDNEKVTKMMIWHNEAAQELNEILGTPAVVLFKIY